MGQELNLDVRPLDFSERFTAIFGKLGEMAADDRLLLVNDFEPVPLFGELESRGYAYESNQVAPTEWHILISKRSP